MVSLDIFKMLRGTSKTLELLLLVASLYSFILLFRALTCRKMICLGRILLFGRFLSASVKSCLPEMVIIAIILGTVSFTAQAIVVR